MASTPAEPGYSANFNSLHRPQGGTGRFMLTLCQLAAPVYLRPPQSPQLKPYTFFMSRAYQADGAEAWNLNMGYFDTLADAERWAESVRRHYPTAFAALAPIGLLLNDETEQSRLPAEPPHPAVAEASSAAPVTRDSLSDSQVLRILGARRASPAHGDADAVPLLRPEDTGTREALKEAVVQGAAVSFAVQLQWSAEPIDLRRVRSLPIFKAHTLYATETRRQEHCRYFLRLGFFADPISAKEVAVQVRSRFASAAVVPVLDAEVTRARAAGVGNPAIPYLEQPDEQETGSDSSSGSRSRSEPFRDAPRHRRSRGGAGRGEQAVQPRAGRGMWSDDADPLSESGVRHLKVEVQEQLSGRWRIVRLSEAQADADS